MSSAGLYYPGNLVWQKPTTMTATDEDSFFPATNLKHFHTTKVFRTIEGVNTCSIVFDFKTTESVDSIIAIGNAVTGIGYSSVVIEANATSNFASPAFSTSLTINPEFNLGHVGFSTQSYRFWKLTFNSAGNYVEISKIYIGKKVDLTTNNLGYDWDYINDDKSNRTYNRYGQQFTDKIISLRNISGSYKALNKTELELLFGVFDEVGTNTPFFFLTDLDCGLVNDFERIGGMFYFNSVPIIKNVSFGLFETSIAIKEAS